MVPSTAPPATDDISSVELTDEEIIAVLHAAKEHKYRQQKQQQDAEQKKAEYDELMRPWTARETGEYAIRRAALDLDTELIIDDDNRACFNALCRYFSGDPAFETMPEGNGLWSLNKGILLLGNVGTGKTLMMRAFARNKKASFNMVNCFLLAKGVRGKDVDPNVYLAPYSRAVQEGYGDTRIFYQRQTGICFDDLGTDELQKVFGNNMNVMAEVILTRYHFRYQLPFYFTHATSNMLLDSAEPDVATMRNFYGTRAFSRLGEMFNVIQLEGKDRRR